MVAGMNESHSCRLAARRVACVLALSLLGAAAHAAPPGLFPAGPPPARVLDVVDVHGADDAAKLAAITLQGVVNRGERAGVFLLLFDTKAYPTLFWLEQLERKGYIEGTRRLAVEAYFDTYAGQAKGLVICDPALPASVNVATMIAGLESRVVVTPAFAPRFGGRADGCRRPAGALDHERGGVPVGLRDAVAAAASRHPGRLPSPSTRSIISAITW